MPRVLLGLAVLGMTIYAVIEAIQTDETRIQHLPKLLWILLIVLTAPVAGVGAILWFFTGKQRGGPSSGGRGRRKPSPPRGPDDDPDFLRSL